MDCTANYTRFATEVSKCLRCLEKEKKQGSCQTSVSGNGGAKPTGDEEFVQTEHGDDNGKQDEGDFIKLTQVKTSKSLILKHEKPKLPFFYGDVRKYFTVVRISSTLSRVAAMRKIP